jgi:L-threonylcarbamoyladenylate synthase
MLDEIENSIHVLTKGGIILYPTDTVWGIGCDATNQNAIKRIYKLKRRAETKSMIVLMSDIDMLKEYVNHIPEIAYDLIECFERPTTVIYPEAKNIAKNLIGSDSSLAIRIVQDDFCKQLVTLFGKPIVSTSANFSGEPTPLLYSKISLKIVQSVDYIVKIDHDKIKQVKPSTIIKLNKSGSFEVVRQ